MLDRVLNRTSRAKNKRGNTSHVWIEQNPIHEWQKGDWIERDIRIHNHEEKVPTIVSGRKVFVIRRTKAYIGSVFVDRQRVAKNRANK
jgi:hypothetical protein